MNKKILRGSLAGVAVVALVAGGSTFASFSDFGSITGNSAGAGFLKLDLGTNGTGSAPFDFQKLKPGDYTNRTLWIASNDGQSVPKANLYVTLHNLQDTAAPCSTSLGKAQGETDSGVTGCSISGNTASGTPSQGNLSRVLTFQGYYYPGITDPAACAALNNGNGTYPSNRTSFFASARGDMTGIASGAGTKYELMSSGTTPLVLSPGQAGCIGIGAGWVSGSDPASPSATHPSDNAAQGDSMTFDARFDLVQSDG
jgi:hypothetical protein